MASKVTIDPSLVSGGVTVKAVPLTFDLDPSELVDGPASAIARAVADGIRARGWTVTGRLASGIKAEPSGEGYVTRSLFAGRWTSPPSSRPRPRRLGDWPTRTTGSLESRINGTKLCGHVSGCPRFHLWHVSGTDRAGKRHGGNPPPSTLRASSMLTCVLDAAEVMKPSGWSAREIGPVFGTTGRAVELVVKRALEKLRSKGVPVDGFEEALERGPHPLE